MRVLYVVHQFYPQFVSGTEQFVLALARAGRARGDDVRVFTVDPDFANVEPPAETACFDVQGVPVIRYRFDKAAVRNHVLTDYVNPEVGESFRALLDEFQPEVAHLFHLRWVGVDRMDDLDARGIPFAVHLMDFWYLCPNFLLLRPDGAICDGPFDEGLSCFDCVHEGIEQWAREPWARERNAEKLARRDLPAHEDSGAEAGYAMMRRPDLLRAALQRASKVYSPSSTVRDVLAAAGTTSAKLELQGYGIDRDFLCELPEPPRDRLVVGFVGTLAPHKGVDVLVEAFRRIGDADLRLEIHGRSGDFPEFDERLRALAEGDARVALAGGFPRQRLAEVLGGLHLLVVPSRWRENTPFVCLEGRAAGLPLIVSDLAGMAEAIPAGRGRGFPAGDVDALERALRQEITLVRERGLRRLDPDDSIPSLREQYEMLRADYTELLSHR